MKNACKSQTLPREPGLPKQGGHLPQHVLEARGEPGSLSVKHEEDGVGILQCSIQNFHHLFNQLIVLSITVTKPRSVHNLKLTKVF